MNLPYTICNVATRQIVKSGHAANIRQASLQAREGEVVLAGVAGNDITQVLDTATMTLVPRPAADLAKIVADEQAHLAAAEALSSPYAVILEALKAEGFNISPEKLAAARARLKARLQAS